MLKKIQSPQFNDWISAEESQRFSFAFCLLHIMEGKEFIAI